MNLSKKCLGRLKVILGKYPVSAAYVFGSQANGQTHAQSDVDVALRYKKSLSLNKTLLLANEITSIFELPADLLDLSASPLPLQFRVYQAGVLVYAENKAQEAMARFTALSLYYDYKYYFDRFIKFETDRILQHGLI